MRDLIFYSTFLSLKIRKKYYIHKIIIYIIFKFLLFIGNFFLDLKYLQYLVFNIKHFIKDL